MEEQSVSTNEIVTHINQTAGGISGAARTIAQSSAASADQMTLNSGQVKSSAEKLTDLARRLNTLINRFKV